MGYKTPSIIQETATAYILFTDDKQYRGYFLSASYRKEKTWLRPSLETQAEALVIDNLQFN